MPGAAPWHKAFSDRLSVPREAEGVLRLRATPGQQRSKHRMPLYMDIHHHVEGLTGDAVASAHEKDLQVQEQYGVKYLK